MTDTKAEIRELRQLLQPSMAACGHPAVDDLDDDAFAGRLRRCLMSLSGGDEPVGFNYACTRTPAGDFAVTLAWQTDGKNPPLRSREVFTAHGENETLAFLRAAEKVFRDEYYQKMLFRRA